MLIALWGIALSRLHGNRVRYGKIIYGHSFNVTRVRVDTLASPVEHDLLDIVAFHEGNSTPQLCLNGHCRVCEFSQYCRRIAIEKDDLSLLLGLRAKEIANLNKKGIFTTTQFSYTFRPRKSRKKTAKQSLPHHQSLQALAKRTDIIYVAQKPIIPAEKTLVYLDIEGIPDQNLYYLIGLRVDNAECCQDLSFWADTPNDEKEIWKSFLSYIESLDEFVVLHYGRYDSKALAELQRRYGGNEELLDRLSSSCRNVLSMIYGHVYFPTYSNDLKSIASCLGFSWSESNASGIKSLVWRHRWETTRDEAYKNKLLKYNHEDCLALQSVTEALTIICNTADVPDKSLPKEMIETENLVRGWPNIYKRNEFFFPALDHINRCAYFDYQRERVFIRTSPSVKHSVRRKEKILQQRIKINKIIECTRPSCCPHCPSTRVFKHGAISKIVRDLKIFDGGVKRWNVKHIAQRYLCKQCKKTFLPKDYPSTRYGNTLRAWIVYQNIALLHSHGNIVEEMRELFSYEYSGSIASRFKSAAALYYEPTFKQILEKIRAGRLIHADETKVSIKGKTGYVWAFTNLEEVAYIYSSTREGNTSAEMLHGFSGVLVSDFYAAYDSADCAQQKCLIHLIRDMNDDLFKNPFDDEMKVLTAGFTELLAPIIDTIDRYGLKKRHLNKHRVEAQRFFKNIADRRFSSEIALGYQRRLAKNEDKLFTFLRHDGIPWNNNNAENALKKFAFLRRIIGGSSTEEGIKEYLILLSVRETLKRKNIGFLGFLLANQTNLNEFLGGR
jgi:predicted RecB family nuclease